MEPLPPATPSGTSPHVASLLKSFSIVPCAAVPAIIDCVLASSAISLPDLFLSLLQAFPASTEGIPSSHVLSHASALCHLIKSTGSRDDFLTRFIWRVLFPLLKAINPSDVELVNQIIGLLCNLIFETHAWDCLGAELVPFCLRSLGLSVGILRSEPFAVYQWSNNDEGVGCLPFPIACRLLTSLLDVSLKTRKEIRSLELDLFVPLNQFSHSLTWDLSKMVLGGLMQSSEYRIFTIHSLLPTIVCSLDELSPVTVFIDGSQHTNSWVCFSNALWNCCVALLSLGHVERLDAYSALSSYFSACNQYKGPRPVTSNDIADRFSMATMKEFWEVLQYGLVDKDGSVRKQALYILKVVLNCCSYLKPDYSLYLSNETFDILENTKISSNSDILSCGSLTKREKWAYEEAKSLGVGEVRHIREDALNSHERWKIFVLLYEMLEEYGTHLVEAAWTHQVSLMFQSTSISSSNPIPSAIFEIQMGNMETIFSWLAVLWERGFCHENPQVRCLIMDSFLSIDWNQCGYYAHQVPKVFVLGPLVRALNDVVHHKDFGVKGVYSSRTIELASKFFGEFSHELLLSDRIAIVWSLASTIKSVSFGRAGLMALACCLGAAASESYAHSENKVLYSTQRTHLPCSIPDLLDVLGIVLERCKQHFNPKYRLKVCQQVIKAASSLITITEIPVDLLLHFLSAIPREFTELNGPLRDMVQSWLIPSGDEHSIEAKLHVLKHLTTFPLNFITYTRSFETSVSYDDEDVNSWGAEAHRWSRVLLLVITEEQQLDQIFMFFEKYSSCLCKYDSTMDWAPIKLLILVLNLVEEIQNGRRRVTCSTVSSSGQDLSSRPTLDTVSPLMATICEKSVRFFVHLLDKFLSFAKLVSPMLWSMDAVKNMPLPASIKGKLGGPSQRRLASPLTASVLQAILSIRTVASILSWSNELEMNGTFKLSFDFLCNFVWEAIQSPTDNSETGAEIRLAVYEALASVLKVFASSVSDLHLKISALHNKFQFPNGEEKPLLDDLSLSFLTNINELLANGLLTRSRRAVLMNWKWICVDALLSVPFNSSCQSSQLGTSSLFFSSSTLERIAFDIIDSLENAGENSILPLLRSVRLVFGLLFSSKASPIMFSLDGASDQMMWQLVESSWILHLSCNKRRVAPIAALLSAVLHKSVFGDISMHDISDGKPGPLKWFIEKLLDDGQKSPRTIRLAALHLTGLWLLYPETIKYYIKELKFLSLYGSVAFDEDFEAELSENYEARIEVSLLAQSPDHEFTEVFINTEMYARASIAALFFKFLTDRDVLGKQKSLAAVEGGKMFLLELLDSVVNEKDLAKELYKKYSGVHRRKVRAWQMICILSHFVEEDIVENVTSKLHTCLYRNNLPAVRQYLENFAIQIYLKFPSLAEKELVPIFCDYSMRQQALSSYVFISANVILHESDLTIRSRHLDELLPPIIPFLTSHHHSLRGFTQLLVFHVLCKLWPVMGLNDSEVSSLEKKCFKELKSYLTGNTDCLRLRSSMEGFLDSFDPCTSSTPAGVFNVHKEGSEFECVPISLMDQVTNFLNDVRDDLRSSTAKDAMTIKNECLQASYVFNGMKETHVNNSGRESLVTFSDASLDFQKKITLNKHLKPPVDVDNPSMNFEIPEVISEFEKEDKLFTSVLQARNHAMEKIRESHQQFILVASLIDRIPNLAGLARTCEVFKAAGLAIADASILHDKQFQLISVTADKWVPIIEVPVSNMKAFLEKKRQEGFSILGLEQTANSTPLDQYSFPTKTVLVLGREKEGIPVEIIHTLDACVEIPQLGIIRSLNVHVSGAIALWEYTRQQRHKQS